ncbi:MAG: flagellar filament capping protein FliD, partial [Ruminiclostridium sp.]
SDGNSIEADGTTFTFTEGSDGTEFTVNIEKDTAAIADTIKGFVEQYNKAIKEIYEYLDEEPESKYYFLADADKEDLELSEKQEEQWEEKAKKGVIYHDSTISNAMTTLRMALMGTVEGADGKAFSLASLGITTATDYNEHGKLMIDEDKLNAAIASNSDDIAKLFSDKDNGIMKKFADALDGAVGTTGDKGTLINKAGLATGSTAKDNEIYELIKKTTQKISSLTERYENEQDRLWKKYSAMEKMLSSLNSQQSSFMSYFSS